MFTFRIHATLDPTKPRDKATEGAAGAYVVCWIDFADVTGAEVLARHYISAAGFIPDEVEDTRSTTREDYADDDQLRSYFDEAVENGCCLSFHLYPAEESE